MSVTQTVEIPASHRLTIDVPREVPTGRAILAFIPAPDQKPSDQRSADTAAEASPPYAGDLLAALLSGTAPLPGGNARTVEEAMRMAEEKASDPNRQPISRLFGTHKGFFGGDGVAYQRAIRDDVNTFLGSVTVVSLNEEHLLSLSLPGLKTQNIL